MEGFGVYLKDLRWAHYSLVFSLVISFKLLSSPRYAILQTIILFFLAAILLKLLLQVLKKICPDQCLGLKQM